MQFKTPPLPIPYHTQILGPSVTRKIQVGGVFNQQILPRLSTPPACAFHVRGQYRLKIHLGIIEKAIGPFEFGPLR